MEILTRRKSKKPAQAMAMCKKHPKHSQSVGVCSICLREKLTKLPSTSSSRPTTIANASSSTSSSSSLSSLSSQCSSNASSCSSPMRDRYHNHNHNRRLEEEGKGYLLSFLKSNKIVLTKSTSMAAYVEEREDGMIKKKKKGVFWSKFIRSKSNNKRMMMHSRTMRDIMLTSDNNLN